jgi:hypothetical protein
MDAKQTAMYVVGIVLACMIIITFSLACYLTSRVNAVDERISSTASDKGVNAPSRAAGMSLASGLGAPTAPARIQGPLQPRQAQQAQQQQTQTQQAQQQAQAQQAQAQAQQAQAQAQQAQQQAQAQQAQQQAQAQQVPGAPEVTAEQALALIGRPTLTNVIITSARCSHCMRLKATLSQLRAAGRLAGFNIVYLSTDELPKLAGKLPISPSVPAIFKVVAGQVVDKAVGNMPADALLDFFSKPYPASS